MQKVSIGLVLALCGAHAWAGNWPTWRGDVAGSGITAEKPPVEWSREKNVKWRVPLPEAGNSTPVVWGSRVFVTQAIKAEHFRGLMCFDRATGKLLWKGGLIYENKERTHPTNPQCSSSPVTDGERVVAAYGSAGLVGYDFEGRELWKRDFGAIDHVWGYGSSPVLYKNLCIHYHGPGEGAFLIAVDKRTGKTVWKYSEPVWNTDDRTDGQDGKKPDITGAFSTPIIVSVDGEDELIMGFPNEVKAFDPLTGKERWNCTGLNPLVYSSPMYGDGVVVAMGGFYGNSLAVTAGGKGDITESNRLWHKVRHNGNIGSGVIKDGYLYYHDSNGTSYCYELATGNQIWEHTQNGKPKAWSSFLLAGDLIYSLSQKGEALVFKAAPEFEQVALNALDEATNSSLAISDGELFIRTHEALWCIGK